MAQPGQHSGPDVGITEEASLCKVNLSQVGVRSEKGEHSKTLEEHFTQTLKGTVQ